MVTVSLYFDDKEFEDIKNYIIINNLSNDFVQFL